MKLTNEPLCPSCGDVPASHRQEKKPDNCGWCGYNHATGEHAYLVPASAPEDEDDYFKK